MNDSLLHLYLVRGLTFLDFSFIFYAFSYSLKSDPQGGGGGYSDIFTHSIVKSSGYFRLYITSR